MQAHSQLLFVGGLSTCLCMCASVIIRCIESVLLYLSIFCLQSPLRYRYTKLSFARMVCYNSYVLNDELPFVGLLVNFVWWVGLNIFLLSSKLWLLSMYLFILSLHPFAKVILIEICSLCCHFFRITIVKLS